MLVPGLAQPRGKVDEARRDDAARGVDAALGVELGRRVADGDDAPAGDRDVAHRVEPGRRIDDAPTGDQDPHAEFPAMMLITAIRTAMPKVTWGRITLWPPSATAESISTPRLIGPGCITIASGRASASLSGVRP